MFKNLSKTDYILYRECPKNSWMKIHKTELYFSSPISEFEKHIIETGNEVELVARGLFPNGILIEGRDVDAQNLTLQHIESKKSTLFQPIFVKDGFLAAVDILTYDKEKDGYCIYEVKASSEVDKKVHIYDLAFQVALLRKYGLNIVGSYIICLNKDYVRKGELDIQKLFCVQDIAIEISDIYDEVEVQMIEAQKYLSESTEPKGYCCCIYKGRSNHCSTFFSSNPHVPEYSIHDIARIGSSKKKLAELVDSNIFHISEIPAHIELSEIQKNQVEAHILDQVLIQKEKISLELQKLQYPLYFVDYETFPSAIPLFDGFSPYQQIPFQYSLYVLESPMSDLKHCEFLHIESGDPSKPFFKSIEKNIGNVGSVIVWNKQFECMINRELAQRIPESKVLMESINIRIFDLMEIFSKQLYVHKDFKGSSSIKKILPVLVPELSYKNLAIQDGGGASKSWHSIMSGTLNKDESLKIAEALKTYCKLDTYAMYAIWKKLVSVIE